MFPNIAQQRDGNYQVINSNEAFILSSTWTFTALTTGAVGVHTLFTITGDVLVNVFAHCTTSVTGSGTGAVGTVGNTTGLITTTTGSSIVATDWWQNATPTVKIGASVSPALPVGSSSDIILTVGTATLTAGVVTFYCTYRPLSQNASIVVATPA